MQPGDESPDVLICGAGPVGLALATQLVRHDIPFRIIERSDTRTTLSKALGLFARSMEVLHSGVDVTAFLETGTVMTGAELHASGRPLTSLTLTGADSPFGTGVMVPQATTERILEESLDAMGRRVERSTRLVEFTDLGERVRCTVQGPGGEETIEPAWLVGCDGAHSVVRHQLGLPFNGQRVGDRWILADCRLDGIDPAPTIIPCFHRDGLLVLFRIKDDRFRVTANTPLPSPDAPHVDPTLEEIQHALDRRGPGGWRAHDPTWLTEFRISERKVDHYRHGRCLLAGDAAHIHSPAGGQGMNTGIQDAANLAWKLALVHRGVAADALLDTYSEERSEIGRQVLASTGRMLRIATLRSRLAAALRNRVARIALGKERVQARLRNFLSGLSLHYPTDSIGGGDHLGVRGDGPAPGERVPDLPLTSQHGADTLHDQLTDPRLTVLLHIETRNGLEQMAAVENAVPPRWRAHLRVLKIMSDAPHPTGEFLHAENDGLVERLGLPAGSFALIRPDGYLLLRGSTDDPAPLTAWCDRYGRS